VEELLTKIVESENCQLLVSLIVGNCPNDEILSLLLDRLGEQNDSYQV